MRASPPRATAVLSEGRVGTAPAPPPAPTLIFDGSCGFCRRWVDRVRRWDRRGAVQYLPMQDERAPQVSGRPRDALQQAAHFVRGDGAVFAGAAAARELFRVLPGGKAAAALLGLPGVAPLAARVYRWVARRWGPVPRDAA